MGGAPYCVSGANRGAKCCGQMRNATSRPKAAARVIWKAIVNRDVPRLYTEAKAFLKLRSQRNRMVKEARSRQADPPAPVGAGA